MAQAPNAVTLSSGGPILQAGSSGPEVIQLQMALDATGFSPGSHDGLFGVGTEAAVKAFQMSCGLLADGIVGPRTRSILAARKSGVTKAIAAASEIPAADTTASMTVQIAARMLPSALLRNVTQNLPKVLDALRARALSDRGMVLVAISTIRAETAGFQPLDEGVSCFNTSPNGEPFDLYDYRKDLGNAGKGDGSLFKGRGFIQLTGRANYKQIGNVLGLPLEKSPESANDPELAARILAEFLKGKELRIKQDLVDGDLRDARRAVNGGSNGLSDFIDAYKIGDHLMPI